MTKQEVFEFIRDNLSLEIDEDHGTGYGRECRSLHIRPMQQTRSDGVN